MKNFKKILYVLASVSVILVALDLMFFSIPSTKTPKTTLIPTPTSFPISYPRTTPIVQPNGGGESPEFLKAGEDYLKTHPILQKFPVTSPYFTIKYIDETHFIVSAKTADIQGDFAQAKIWFSQNSIDTSNILIEYK